MSNSENEKDYFLTLADFVQKSVNDKSMSVLESLGLFFIEISDFSLAESMLEKVEVFSSGNEWLVETLKKLKVRRNIIENGPFYGKTFVITGILENCGRSEALELINYLGGNVSDKPVNSMDILVVGNQEWTAYNGGLASRKIIKASELIEEGKKIEIIDENTLLKTINAFIANFEKI